MLHAAKIMPLRYGTTPAVRAHWWNTLRRCGEERSLRSLFCGDGSNGGGGGGGGGGSGGHDTVGGFSDIDSRTK